MEPDPFEDDRTIIRPSPAQQVTPRSSTAYGDDGNALPSGTRLGEFELLSVIGEGGFGIVYLALDHSLQRKVAIKEYMPQALAKREQTIVSMRNARHQESFAAGLKSFINEAKLLAQFDHPALVKVHRFWEANGTAYMVMPLYSGPTLRQELSRRRDASVPIDEAWLLNLLDALTQALSVLHASNCFHRDIAPDNILLLDGNSKPLLLDFGAARTVIGDMTQALTVILKPGYAPIEQYAEVPDMRQGAWTDVYALASTVYFAIRGSTPPPAVSRLVNDSYVSLEKSPPTYYGSSFLTALDRALKVRPADRTQSMEAFRADLGLPATGSIAASNTPFFESIPQPSAIQRQSDSIASARTQPTAQPPAPHNRVPLMALTSIALIGASAFMYWQFGRSGPQAEKDARATTSLATNAVNPTVLPAIDARTAAPAEAPGLTATSIVNAGDAVPAAAPHATLPNSVKAQMEAVLATQTPRFTVNASSTRPSFRIDKDSLSFSVTSERDGFVHVLWLNAENKLTLLFPNSLMEVVRIKAGQTLTLPPKQIPMVAAKPEGKEYFLVMVSAQERDFSNLNPKKVDGFLELNANTASTGRGQAALVGVSKACNILDCQDFGAALFSIHVIR
jgi:serine/threonine protein kinase